MGCHSVIDRPECVSRVTPPTTIIANTSAQQTRSHAATARGAAGGVCRQALGDGAGSAGNCGGHRRIIPRAPRRPSCTTGRHGTLATVPRRMRPMNRRLAAWLALLSMLAGIVLPAHAHARAFGAGRSRRRFLRDRPGREGASRGAGERERHGVRHVQRLRRRCRGASVRAARAAFPAAGYLARPRCREHRDRGRPPCGRLPARSSARALTCNERCAAVHAARRSVPRDRPASRPRIRMKESPCRPNSRSWGSSSR